MSQDKKIAAETKLTEE
jgi:hypothetical protein